MHPTRETSFFCSTRPRNFRNTVDRMRKRLLHEYGETRANNLQGLRGMQVSWGCDHDEVRSPAQTLLPVAKIQRLQPRPQWTSRRDESVSTNPRLLDPKFFQVPQMPAANGTTAHHQRLHFFPVRFPGLYSERSSPIRSRSLYSPFRNRSSRIRPSTLNPAFL